MQNLLLPFRQCRDHHATLGLILMMAVGVAGMPSLRITANSDHSYGTTANSMDLLRELQQVDGNCTLDCCSVYEDDLCGSDANAWIAAIPFSLQIILVVILILTSALFSGLTLGLMSLDKSGLEIIMSGDDPEAARYAKTIYPLRKDGNLLLCTLVLGNVAVNALLSILMAEYAGGLIGMLSSTFLIVIFGEITPQAACARYPLWVGSTSVPLMKVIRAIFYPCTKPLAWCLDRFLGAELATVYSNAELTKLLQIHVQHNVIDQETAGAMTGALTYKNITVKEVMTPIERTFMVNVDDKLSFETIAKIFKTGYSRIPVYEVSRNNIIGLLFVKDLIFIDPADEVPVKSFVQIFGRGVHVVWPDDTLGGVLSELKKGRSHLAVVRDVNNSVESIDPFYEVKGIITLEDIIEKIIGDNIVDETDEYVDRAHDVKVNRAAFEWASLRLLDTKIVDELLSSSEANAVTAHLRMNYSPYVQLLTDTQLTRLVSTTPVSTLETAKHQLGKELPDQLLYEKGVPSDTCTLILGGKVTVLVGAENFRSDLSSWAVIGISAFEKSDFCPDFTAFVSDGPCRCLRLTRAAFVAAVDASAIERTAIEARLGDTIPGESLADVTNRREELLARLNMANPVLVEATEDAVVDGETSDHPVVVAVASDVPVVVDEAATVIKK